MIFEKNDKPKKKNQKRLCQNYYQLPATMIMQRNTGTVKFVERVRKMCEFKKIADGVLA
ncbi:hypothetical protein Q5O14_01880 [Eubacteriaceae bacterium ES2]|nr:hypothetical protein Q5O14_01880 [Eubacteriaceae bacterium ES2]